MLSAGNTAELALDCKTDIKGGGDNLWCWQKGQHRPMQCLVLNRLPIDTGPCTVCYASFRACFVYGTPIPTQRFAHLHGKLINEPLFSPRGYPSQGQGGLLIQAILVIFYLSAQTT